MDIKTFSDDLFELKEFSERLNKFIQTEHKFVPDGLVIALSSEYGTGKTTFLNMWKDSLENENSPFKPKVISLNAWESDYFGDPLFAIVSALLEQLKDDSAEKETKERILSAVKDVGNYTTAMANQVVKKATGLDAIAAGDYAEKKKTKRDKSNLVLPDSFSVYLNRKQAMAHLKDAIREFVKDDNVSVLFFVDELDRCRPDYAISYLETIKHIFDIKGAAFILAADREQLENSAKSAFGQDLNFDEYYRKFVNREVKLPKLSASECSKLVENYLSQYVDATQIRMSIFDWNNESCRECLKTLIIKLKPSVRQIQEVFRLIGHSTGSSNENRFTDNWVIQSGIILMCTLKVCSSGLYEKVGKSELSIDEATNLFKDVTTTAASLWYLILYTGKGLLIENNDQDFFKTIKKKTGLHDDDFRQYQRDGISHIKSAWGFYNENPLPEIYYMLEDISQWK